MKQNYLNAAYTQLILEKDYQPVYLENGSPLNDPEFKVLMRSLPKVEEIVELIDGDCFSVEAINDRLASSPEMNAGFLGKAVHYFMVFVFHAAPPPDKAEAVEKAANQSLPFQRIILTVNMAEKKVVSPGRAKWRTFIAVRLFQKLFDKDLSEYRDVPDPDQLMTVRRREYTLQFRTGVPLVTYVLVGLNAAVFLAIWLYTQSKGLRYEDFIIPFGAKDNVRIMAGEYWRLFTAIFIHGSWEHVVVNCYSLYVLGSIMERIYGHWKYAVIYFGASLFGSVASFAFSPEPSVGASGAIVGLFGALFYFGLERPNLFRKYFQSGVIITIVLNFIIFIAVPGLDNFGHLGGLVGGFLIAGVVKVKSERNHWGRRGLLLLATFVIGVGGLVYGFGNLQNRYAFQLDLLDKQIQEKKVSPARTEQIIEPMLREGLRGNNLQISALTKIIWAEAVQKKYPEGIAHAKTLVKLDPLSGHYWLGILYYYTHQLQSARDELQRALRLDPGNRIVLKALNEVEQK